MNILAIVFAACFAFKLGMWYDRWSSGRLDIEEGAFNAGYDTGYKDGHYDGRGGYDTYNPTKYVRVQD